MALCLRCTRFKLSAVLLLLQAGKFEVHSLSSHSEGEGPHSKPSAKWRIVNLDAITYGWAVGEVKMFTDTKCTEDQELTALAEPKIEATDPFAFTWDAISSGYDSAPASRAFDRLTWTEWRSNCYMCDPRTAWVGLQFSSPVTVQCFYVYQWGKRTYKTDEVMLQRWEQGLPGTNQGEWQDVLRGSGLEGETWQEVSFTLCDELPAPDHGRVEVSNGRFYPSVATFTCSGARIMWGSGSQECQPDGTWAEDIPQCWPALVLVVFVSSLVACEVVCFGTYYFFVLQTKPPPLQHTTFIPDDALGKFTSHEIYGIRDEEEDDGATTRPKRVFLHVVFCLCCRIADTWHSVGQVSYFVGVWLPQLLCPLLPCIATYFRVQMRRRFQIKGSIHRDLCLWIFCIPCVATQEAKHVDHMCDLAEEEAEVMKRAEERKKEKERKIREQIEAKNNAGGVDGRKVGKAQDDQLKHADKLAKHADKQKHPTFMLAKSVMDMVESV
jgi:Cys-rich protein (TIGR01571 family)